MRERLNRRIVVLMLFVAVLTVPLPSGAQPPQTEAARDTCGFARKVEFFAGMSAFGLGLIPPLAPVAIAYGIVALAAKGFVVAKCE